MHKVQADAIGMTEKAGCLDSATKLLCDIGEDWSTYLHPSGPEISDRFSVKQDI